MRGGAGLFVLFRLAGQAVDQVELGEEFGLFKRCFALLAAFGLEVSELLQVPLHVAVDALPIDAQELEFIGVIEEGLGVGQGDPDGIVLLLAAEGEDVAVEGADAVEPPAVLCDRSGELPSMGVSGLRSSMSRLTKASCASRSSEGRIVIWPVSP